MTPFHKTKSLKLMKMSGSRKRPLENECHTATSWSDALLQAFANKQDATKPFLDEKQETVVMQAEGPSAYTREEKIIKTLSLKNLCCWDGYYLNIGESYVSELLIKSHDTLEMVVYNPSTTKKGVLVRTLYCMSSQEGGLELPRLMILGITSRVSRVPFEYGWITPNLKTLVVFAHSNYWAPWQKKDLRDKLLVHCPRLERIVICDAKFLHTPRALPMRDFESTLKDVICIFYPPRLTSWQIIRLFWIAKIKPNPGCCMSWLPKDMVNYLVSFLCCGWRQVGEAKVEVVMRRKSVQNSDFSAISESSESSYFA